MTRVEEAMLYAEMTQQELSDKTGIHKSTISRYVNGVNSPKGDTAKLIGDATGTNPSWIIGLSEDMVVQSEAEKKRSMTVEQEMSEMMLAKVIELFHTLEFNQQVHLFEIIRKEEMKFEATKQDRQRE